MTKVGGFCRTAPATRHTPGQLTILTVLKLLYFQHLLQFHGSDIVNPDSPAAARHAHTGPAWVEGNLWAQR